MKLLLALSLATLCSNVLAAQLACPELAPPSISQGAAPLSSVRIFSYEANAPLPSDEALPIMAPDTERTNAKRVIQTWRINRDAPKYRYALDCIYGDGERFVRYDIPRSVRSCKAVDDLRSARFATICN